MSGVEILKIGVGVGLPTSNDKDFHALALFSVFYHFRELPPGGS